MQHIIDILSDVGFWKIAAPIAFAIAAWILNERAKRTWEEYKRKEERYIELLRTFKGFYAASEDTLLKEEFLLQLNMCWLYAPDEIIEHGYKFLDKIKVGAMSTDMEKERAAGELFAAIRRDLISRRLVKSTRLGGKDYRHLRAT